MDNDIIDRYLKRLTGVSFGIELEMCYSRPDGGGETEYERIQEMMDIFDMRIEKFKTLQPQYSHYVRYPFIYSGAQGDMERGSEWIFEEDISIRCRNAGLSDGIELISPQFYMCNRNPALQGDEPNKECGIYTHDTTDPEKELWFYSGMASLYIYLKYIMNMDYNPFIQSCLSNKQLTYEIQNKRTGKRTQKMAEITGGDCGFHVHVSIQENLDMQDMRLRCIYNYLRAWFFLGNVVNLFLPVRRRSYYVKNRPKFFENPVFEGGGMQYAKSLYMSVLEDMEAPKQKRSSEMTIMLRKGIDPIQVLALPYDDAVKILNKHHADDNDDNENDDNEDDNDDNDKDNEDVDTSEKKMSEFLRDLFATTSIGSEARYRAINCMHSYDDYYDGEWNTTHFENRLGSGGMVACDSGETRLQTIMRMYNWVMFNNLFLSNVIEQTVRNTGIDRLEFDITEYRENKANAFTGIMHFNMLFGFIIKSAELRQHYVEEIRTWWRHEPELGFLNYGRQLSEFNDTYIGNINLPVIKGRSYDMQEVFDFTNCRWNGLLESMDDMELGLTNKLWLVIEKAIYREDLYAFRKFAAAYTAHTVGSNDARILENDIIPLIYDRKVGDWQDSKFPAHVMDFFLNSVRSNNEKNEYILREILTWIAKTGNWDYFTRIQTVIHRYGFNVNYTHTLKTLLDSVVAEIRRGTDINMENISRDCAGNPCGIMGLIDKLLALGADARAVIAEARVIDSKLQDAGKPAIRLVKYLLEYFIDHGGQIQDIAPDELAAFLLRKSGTGTELENNQERGRFISYLFEHGATVDDIITKEFVKSIALLRKEERILSIMMTPICGSTHEGDNWNCPTLWELYGGQMIEKGIMAYAVKHSRKPMFDYLIGHGVHIPDDLLNDGLKATFNLDFITVYLWERGNDLDPEQGKQIMNTLIQRVHSDEDMLEKEKRHRTEDIVNSILDKGIIPFYWNNFQIIHNAIDRDFPNLVDRMMRMIQESNTEYVSGRTLLQMLMEDSDRMLSMAIRTNNVAMLDILAKYGIVIDISNPIFIDDFRKQIEKLKTKEWIRGAVAPLTRPVSLLEGDMEWEGKKGEMIRYLLGQVGLFNMDILSDIIGRGIFPLINYMFDVAYDKLSVADITKISNRLIEQNLFTVQILPMLLRDRKDIDMVGLLHTAIYEGRPEAVFTLIKLGTPITKEHIDLAEEMYDEILQEQGKITAEKASVIVKALKSQYNSTDELA